MERQEILDMMGQLKLIGMRSDYDGVLEDGIRRQQPMPYVVGALLQAQIAAAHARSIAYQMGMARFSMAKTLAQFDFSASPVNEALIREWHGGGFLDQQRNLIVVGGTGTGKTHVCRSAPADDPFPNRLKQLIYNVESRGGWGHNRRR